MKTKINALLNLAAMLPTGLRDPQALNKLERELEELKEAALTGDCLSAAMEAGDVAYYAIKAAANGLLGESQRDGFIHNAAGFVGLKAETLLDCAIAKYELRARLGSPKDDQAERMAVGPVLAAWSPGDWR